MVIAKEHTHSNKPRETGVRSTYEMLINTNLITMRKRKGKIYKKRTFTKSVKVRPIAYDFIVEETDRLEYRTYAGTLDKIINYYRKNHHDKKSKSNK